MIHHKLRTKMGKNGHLVIDNLPVEESTPVEVTISKKIMIDDGSKVCLKKATTLINCVCLSRGFS